MSWLADLIPPPHTRGPLTFKSFIDDLLPPILCYYVTAVLVLLPDTLFIRLALLPLTLGVAFRGATRVDAIAAFNDDRLRYWNQGLVLILTSMAMRSIVWSFQRKPFRRVTTVDDDDDDTQAPPNFKQVFIDAMDLTLNMRGCGWNWPIGIKIPPETRPTSSTTAFVTATSTSLALHILIFDVIHYSIQWFAPLTVGSAKGGTIFDSSLPLAQRYLHSSTITALTGLIVYCAVQIGYHLCTLIGIILFRQHFSSWPPIFKDPWFSTSLTELWAKCWHQLFRDVFVSLGGNPMARLAGRVGGVFGAFLVSGVMHYIGLWGMGSGSDFPRVVGFFVMMGIGIIMEHTLKVFTGQRTGGFYGWIWTWIWTLGWGHMLVEAWVVHGLAGSVFFPLRYRPASYVFGPLP